MGLAACGGGGEDSPDPVPTTPPPATGTPAPGASTQLTSANTCGIADYQQSMLEQINAARATARLCGTRSFSAAPPLAWNDLLFAAAAGHAEDMAVNNYFSHDALNGRTFSQRISDAGYNWSAAGENLAAGQAGISQVITAWLDSPGHCENLMSTSFTEVGVACVRNDAARYGQYWAMSLGRPR